MKKEIPVLLRGAPGIEANISLEIDEWALSKRLQRAAAALLLCWLGAGAAVFIPIFHFLLVPGLFLGGIVLGLYFYLQKGLITDSGVKCPNCGGALSLSSRPLKFPQYLPCPKCSQQLFAERQAA